MHGNTRVVYLLACSILVLSSLYSLSLSGQSDVTSEELQKVPSSSESNMRPISRTFDFVHDATISVRRGPELNDPEKTGATAPSAVAGESVTLSPQGWQTIMTENFEGPFPSPGWIVTGNPGWDDQSCMAATGSWSAWCANGGASGVEPCPGEVHYFNNMNTWMIYGPFDLSDATQAEVYLSCYLSTEVGFDFFSVYDSPNGVDFYATAQASGHHGWAGESFLVSSWGGDPSVWFALSFQSDASVTDSGVYIDDIVLRKYLAADLRCFTPPGEAGPIVVSCVEGQRNQCSPVMAGQPTYINYWFENSGAGGTEQTFHVTLEATSSPVGPFILDEMITGPLSAGNWTGGYRGGVVFMDPGIYNLRLFIDDGGAIPESNESNNFCTYSFEVLPATLPDLQCYTPPVCPGPIVVTCAPTDSVHQCSPVPNGADLYIYCWFRNAGGPIDRQFNYQLDLISGPIGPGLLWWNMISPPFYSGELYGFRIGPTTLLSVPGVYVLRMTVDYSGTVAESNENNNTCTYSFTVSSTSCACNCHCDPACDGHVDVLDVVETIDVAFRAGAPVPDPSGNCPRQRTDTDCNGATDVVDVVHMVNVAFRAANATTEFCRPCP